MFRRRWTGIDGQRVLAAAIASALGVACAEPDPPFGNPGTILGRPLPNETVSTGGSGGPFGGPYDPNAGKPQVTMRDSHGTAQPPPGDTLDCMTCHKDGVNASGAPSFSYGGRINDGDAPVADADVIVVQEDGTKLGPVKSDVDGLFWYAGPPIKDGAITYVRKGSSAEKRMGGTLTAASGGGCNGAGCHLVDGVPGKIRI